ncbi:MAG: branched-chain amino acid ABC transporter substrate-binding protein [Burkholderiaceae bacterium]|jgi:branched-chain amino acid transport system substrate-binding protein|nr:branched-chain amino acid ABC transporter substrate-binding protein [Burkholderiaceae bacterium]MDH5207743.1 branched-chain amino acid ABC transporter substrate-binding protein [Burkholderiaceae bacterium]
MNQTLFKVAPLAIAAAVALAACGKKEEAAPKAEPAKAAAAPAAEVIKVGHVGPLTGGIAHLGKDNENGARLAVEEINAAGGIKVGDKTFKLELVAEDDKADPKEGTLAAQKIVDSGAVAIVGHLNSGTTIPASKIYADANMTQISPSATNPKYTEQGFKTAFRVVANDNQQGAVLANYAADTLKAKTIAIVDDRTAYGQGLADVVEKVAKEKGIKVVGREFTNDKATDFNAILTKIRGAKPDVIMYGGMDATAGPMAKQIKQLGIKATFLAGDGVCSPEFVKLAGDAAGILTCSMAGEAVEKLAKGAEFVDKYKKRFNQDVQIYSPYSYDAVYIIADAMKRAGKADRASITAAMPTTNYNGLTGTIAFDDKGDIKGGAISMFKVNNGKLEYVSTVR